MEKALVDTSGFGTTAVAATARTVLASTDNVTMSIASDDSYKTVPIEGPTINNSLLNIFKINGENFNAATDRGLQGSTIPKDVDGGTPSSTLTLPYSGCVYSFIVKKEGYLYIFAKLHSDITYTVFEGGVARDYLYVQGTDSLNNVLSFSLTGDTNGLIHNEVLTPQKYDARYGTAYNTASMGVIKVKVSHYFEYLFSAFGSKATVLGYCYDEDGKATIDITDRGTIGINLLTEGSVPTRQKIVKPAIGVPELAPLIDGNCVTKAIYIFNNNGADIESVVNNTIANLGVDAFNTTNAYVTGDVVMYKYRMYRFTAAHAAGAWLGTDAEVWSIKKML